MLDKLKEIGDHFDCCLTIVDMNDPKHPCIYANNKFFDNTGYNFEEVSGKNLAFLQGEDTSTDTITFMQKCFSNNEPCCQDIVNYKKDGTPFINRLVMLPLEYENHNYFFGFQNDITNKFTIILGKIAIGLHLKQDPSEELHEKLEKCFKDINNFCLNIEEHQDFHYL